MELSVSRHPMAISVVRLFRAGHVQCEALGDIFQCAWPTEPNTVSGTTFQILWMGPSEWAVVGLPASVVVANVTKACAGALYQVADMSSGYAAFQITGSNASALMAKACSLDFHLCAFRPGSCAQSLFAQVSALIHRPSQGSGFWIYVPATVSDYLWEWFTDASVEYVGG